MNQHALFKHLFSKVKIPDSPINKIFSEYKRKNNISEQNNSLYSLFFKNKSTSKELHKSENLIKNSNLKISKILKNNSIKLKIKTKGTKMNSLDNKSQNKYSTNTTQTAFIIEKPSSYNAFIVVFTENTKLVLRPSILSKLILINFSLICFWRYVL